MTITFVPKFKLKPLPREIYNLNKTSGGTYEFHTKKAGIYTFCITNELLNDLDIP